MDNTEFGRQLQRLYPIMHVWASRYVSEPEARRDLVHDTIVKALLNGNRYDPKRGLKSWLSRIMRNCFIDQYRSRRSAPFLAYLEDVSEYHVAVPEGQSTYLEVCEVWGEIGRLPAVTREAFQYFVQGYTGNEVKEETGIPVKTYRSRIVRGCASIQKRLANT